MIMPIFLTVTLIEFLIGLILDQILPQGGILLLHISERNRRNAINIICIIILYFYIYASYNNEQNTVIFNQVFWAF